jgi:hypothetical protein
VGSDDPPLGSAVKYGFTGIIGTIGHATGALDIRQLGPKTSTGNQTDQKDGARDDTLAGETSARDM